MINRLNMTFTAQSEGGNYQHTLTQPELPQQAVANVNSQYGFSKTAWFVGAGWQGNSGKSDQPFSLLPPYKSTYFWRRIS